LKPEAQTALITFNIFCGLLLVIYAQPPLKFFVGGDKFSGDWRPTIMAGVILAGFFVVMAIEPFRKLFDLYPLSLLQFLIIAGAALLYGLILMFVWRKKLLDRMLGVNFGGPQPSEW
jgi:cation-transporting ATPase E